MALSLRPTPRPPDLRGPCQDYERARCPRLPRCHCAWLCISNITPRVGSTDQRGAHAGGHGTWPRAPAAVNSAAVGDPPSRRQLPFPAGFETGEKRSPPETRSPETAPCYNPASRATSTQISQVGASQRSIAWTQSIRPHLRAYRMDGSLPATPAAPADRRGNARLRCRRPRRMRSRLSTFRPWFASP